MGNRFVTSNQSVLLFQTKTTKYFIHHDRSLKLVVTDATNNILKSSPVSLIKHKSDNEILLATKSRGVIVDIYTMLYIENLGVLVQCPDKSFVIKHSNFENLKSKLPSFP